MPNFSGEEKLLKQKEVGFPKGVTKITDGVYFALGYGGSTCTLVEADNSCVLVDTLNSATVAEKALEEFRKYTDKPITHIIYTHYAHFDHTSGAGAFYTEGCEIIGRKPSYPQYGKSEMLGGIAGKRGAKQFGVGLTPEEGISVGIGPLNDINAVKKVLKPNRLFSEEKLELNIDGLKIELTVAPGETDDQIFVWFPEKKVLCCGDNYYESWPNLFAIRGGQYRDVAGWVDALTAMIDCGAEYLLPGHTRAVIGKEKVKETLTNFRDAIEFVLVETLKGMNEGLTIDELVEKVKLPEHLANLPYTQEYYGTVEWSVRSIFVGYLGWFDGNPVNLFPIPPKEKAVKSLALMGGYDKVLSAIKDAVANEEYKWGLELCEILTQSDNLTEEAKNIKADILTTLGRMQISANARHFYISSAKQLLGTLKAPTMPGFQQDWANKKEMK